MLDKIELVFRIEEDAFAHGYLPQESIIYIKIEPKFNSEDTTLVLFWDKRKRLWKWYSIDKFEPKFI